MGLFDFGKKEKKKNVSKKEEFELGSEGIVFRAVIEILGSPKKYVEDTIKAYVEQIKGDHTYHIRRVNIPKSKKVSDKNAEAAGEKGKELFSIFAELEVATKKKEKVFDFCFNFMPSSIEITEPMNLNFSANELSSYLSDVQATLHKIDFSLKNANAANQVLNSRVVNLTKSMVRVLRNNIILSLKEKNKDLKEISKNVGISEDQIKPFVDSMLKDNEIKLDKDKYAVVK